MMQYAVLISALLGFASVKAQDTPDSVLAKLTTRVDSLLQKNPPPLFSWHLRSLKALALSEYSKLEVQSVPVRRRNSVDRAKEFVDYVGTIEKGLGQFHSDPDDCLKNGRGTLILARPSSTDGSLQYMMVDLPKGWEPNREYPLFIGLHGSGPDNPLAYPSFAFGPPSPAGPSKPGDGMIRLTPWGRGNRSWRNDAESDLWEAIDLLRTFAKIDVDRCYISGHSSGADGTWAIVQHTPDLWAAVGIQSGSMYEGRPEWGLIPNMKYVPTYFLIGENDPLPHRVPDMKEAYKILTEMGGEAKLNILPGIGHYPLTDAGLNDQMAWMITHVRKRPTHFEFTVDQFQHPGVWGITVPLQDIQRRQIMQPWPWFKCQIEGQSVYIQTLHTDKIRIDAKALQLSGSVKIWVNEKLVHNGPAPEQALTIG